jgi:flagellar biosynthetic protein FliR
MVFPVEMIAGLVLVLFRCAALCMTAPIFSTPMVSIRVRIVFAMVMSVVAFTGAGSPHFVIETVPQLLFAAGVETILGATSGLVARFFLDATIAAGHIGGLSMGLGMGSLIDPMSGTSTAPLSRFFSTLGLAYAVSLGVHKEAVLWLAQTLREFPPGSGAVDVATLMQAALLHSIGSLYFAVRLGFPILAAVIFGHMAVGLLGRIAPQMNLQSLGFSVAIMSGGYAVFLASPYIGEYAARMAKQIFSP